MGANIALDFASFTVNPWPAKSSAILAPIVPAPTMAIVAVFGIPHAVGPMHGCHAEFQKMGGFARVSKHQTSVPHRRGRVGDALR